ncbi:hypothetical protein [Corynebacterium riegelii]|uniref:hypothetical protein n=1 Tax=Corynebacterium riegelii TaxID=156976 RepID=UPI00288A6AF9|nr:hypothetical protein [Corynebacterium riegelii]
MGKHSIEATVEQARAQEPAWLRYKGTIIIILTGLVSVLTQVAALPEWEGTTGSLVATIVATTIGALLNRFTKDGITPSMGPRIAAAEGGSTRYGEAHHAD